MPRHRPRASARPPVAADDRTVEQRLADALAQQAATAEILRVMAASPTDAQPVMHAVAEHAARLCGAEFARVFIADAGLLRPLAHYASDGSAATPVYAVPMQRTSISGRAAVDRATVHHADVVPLLETEYPDARENARETRLRAVLAVPLIRDGAAYGAIFLWRRAPGLFAPDHVALVETFATQAAIAIANVRLFQATRESLEQQTATSEILRVISRSQTDVQPVFDTIVSSAVRLCGSQHSLIFSLQDEVLKPVARHVMSQEFFDYWARSPLRPGKGSIAGRAALERRTIHVPDAATLTAYEHRDAQQSQDFHTVLAVPLLRDGALLGVIVTWKTIVEPFSDKQVELIETFADQAVIAIENVRLFTELEDAQPRPDRGARAADGDERDPARDQPVADRRPARVRDDRRERAAAVRRHVQRHLPVRRRADPRRRAAQTSAREAPQRSARRYPLPARAVVARRSARS